VIERRNVWIEMQQTLDVTKLVFLDESSINTGMTRLYGRAKGKKRVVEYVPDVRFQRTSILSTIRLSDKMCPMIFKGSLNGELFKKYITDLLVPTLSIGDIVVMDNLQSHKVSGIVAAIEAAGAKVLYLPPYSPDLNPIELMWSKVKAYLRKRKARTLEVLNEAINEALKTITQTDLKNWFAHDGYRTPTVN